jgi:hypothetical protein
MQARIYTITKNLLINIMFQINWYFLFNLNHL